MTPFLKQSSPFISTLTLIILMAGCSTTRQSSQTNTQPSESRTETDGKPASYQKLERPIPQSIDFEIPYPYMRAISEGTRSTTGKPGNKYWQQQVDYSMDVELIPDEKRVVGKSTITYHNNSPDSLSSIVLELAQNVHSEGVPRKEFAEITGGIDIQSIKMEGKELEKIQYRGQRGYIVDATRLFIETLRPIMPDDSTSFEIEWSFKVPQQGAGGRMGYSRDNLFFIAYWYPQVAVYDDVFGWFADLFTNNAEFYHEFGEYQVNITAPEQWIVTATGNLQNAEEVLLPSILRRYRRAQESDSVTAIAGQKDIGRVTRSGTDGKVTWSYHADKVKDFAFSVTRESNWEGARAPVGDRNGDGTTDYTFVDAVYRSSATKWKEAVKYAQHSITFLSEYTGIPYPWPHMTSVEGEDIIGGGMEFPMMTVIGSYNYAPQSALYNVIAHEFAHMWVPMIVSTNERRYSWMDEGTTTFNENQSRKSFFPDSRNPDINDFRSYTNLAGTFLEGPIMRWSDYHYPGPAFGTASYSKPASGLAILRNLLGEETFNKAYRSYLDQWKYKHPYPWDMFNTFEEVSGRDLDWFWRSYYYETWILDHAVAGVSSNEKGTQIVIEDKGQMPLPAHVVITLGDGQKLSRTIEVNTWLQGATNATITIDTNVKVTHVEIDPDHYFPDVNRSNNVWTR